MPSTPFENVMKSLKDDVQIFKPEQDWNDLRTIFQIVPEVITDPGEYRKLMNSQWDKAELPIMHKPDMPVGTSKHARVPVEVRRVAYESAKKAENHAMNIILLRTFVTEFKDDLYKALYTSAGGPSRRFCVSNALDQYYGKITAVCMRTNLPKPTPYVNVVAIPTILYHDALNAQYNDLLNLICMHPIWDYIARLYLNPVGSLYKYDLYTICTAFTRGVDPDEVTKEQREEFKKSRMIAKYEPCVI